MRVIYFNGYGDYDAVEFERIKPNLEELYDEIKNGLKTFSQDDCDGDVWIYEFKDVDREFIKFVKERVLDRYTKNQSNFYIVEDGWKEE